MSQFSKFLTVFMPKVTFTDDDLTIDAELDANLRDLAQAEGASIPFGCEQGICGTCLMKPDDETALSDIDDQERETLDAMGAEDGERLACQCRVQSDVDITSAH